MRSSCRAQVSEAAAWEGRHAAYCTAMRILVVSDLFPPVAFGGYELECAALVARLRERHEVVVLTSDLRQVDTPPQAGVLRELPYMGGRRWRAALGAPFTAITAARHIRRLLEGFRPDAMYISNANAVPQTAIVIAAATGVPTVCRFSELWFARSFLSGDRFLRHLSPGERGVRGLWARVARLVNRHPALRLNPDLRFPAAVSWNSEALRRLAGVPPAIDPVVERVIYPATDRNAAFGRLERRPSPEPTVAYVGRVTSAKGAEVACRALSLLRRDHGVDARLVFAGDCRPQMRRRLSRLNRALGVEGFVALLGALDTEQLGALLATAHVVVVPSIEPEAFGLAAVEAALAGAPVVASNIGGIPEALADGEHALLFAPGDPAACARALANVLADPAATRLRVRAALERAKQFSLESYLDESEKLIARVAKRSSG